jgi:hypothetical protein
LTTPDVLVVARLDRLARSRRDLNIIWLGCEVCSGSGLRPIFGRITPTAWPADAQGVESSAAFKREPSEMLRRCPHWPKIQESIQPLAETFNAIRSFSL